MSDYLESAYLDGEAFANPFLAMTELGQDWATTGMSIEDMTDAAEACGGPPLGRNAEANLSGLAKEFIMRISQPISEGEK